MYKYVSEPRDERRPGRLTLLSKSGSFGYLSVDARRSLVRRPRIARSLAAERRGPDRTAPRAMSMSMSMSVPLSFATSPSRNAAARLRRRMHVCSGDRRVSACQSDVRAASPRMRHMRRRALDRPASRAMPDRPATVERRARARSGCRPAGPTVSFFGSRCGACDIRDARMSRRARGRRSHAAPAPAVCIHINPYAPLCAGRLTRASRAAARRDRR